MRRRKKRRVIFSQRISLRFLYPQFIRKTVRRHKIAFCRVILIPSSLVHFPFKRVLPGANFMPSDSAASKKKNVFIFKADEEGVTYEYAD